MEKDKDLRTWTHSGAARDELREGENSRESEGETSGEQPWWNDLRGYDDQIRALEEVKARYTPESNAERAKREQRERSRRLLRSIGDGLGALSNMIFTSRYAPNAYDGTRSQTATYDQRLEALKADRKANEDAHYNAVLKLGEARNAKARTLREIAAQQQQMDIAKQDAANRQDQFGWEKELRPMKKDKLKAESESAGYQRDILKVNADYAEQEKQAGLGLTQAKTVSAGRRGSGGTRGGGRGGGSSKGFYVQNKNGGTRFIADSELDKEFAALDAEDQRRAGTNGRHPNKEEKKQAVAAAERKKSGKGANTQALGL